MTSWPCQELKALLYLLDGESGSEPACAVCLGPSPGNSTEIPQLIAHSESLDVLVPVYRLVTEDTWSCVLHVPCHGGTRYRICPFASTDQSTGLTAVLKVLLLNRGACVGLFTYQNKEFVMEDILGLVRSDYHTHPQLSEQEMAFMNFAVPL